MKKNNENESAENKKSIAEFFLIAIPVGAFMLIAVVALILGIVFTEKKRHAKEDLNAVSVETDKNVGDNTENDIKEKEETKENGMKTETVTDTFRTSKLDTGNLSQTGSGYEGTKGTGNTITERLSKNRFCFMKSSVPEICPKRSDAIGEGIPALMTVRMPESICPAAGMMPAIM